MRQRLSNGAAVFSGAAVSDLALIRAGISSLSFQAVRGKTSQIAIADASGRTGTIMMALKAPVIEEPLLLAQRSPRASSATLLYRVKAGDKVVLQRSMDRQQWQNVGVAFARYLTVSFIASPAPTAAGPFYRAVIDDYLGL